MTDRKPGAQPGNTNALKHGFYSKRFSEAEKERLDGQSPSDVTAEIAFLRVCLDRLMKNMYFDTDEQDHTDGKSNYDPSKLDQHLLNQLNTAANITQAIATLTRTQHLIHGKGGEVEDAIKQAFEEIRLDLGI